MKLPNGYGAVIRLSGKRRKPYAVRITTGTVMVGQRARRQYKYLGYFTKRADAIAYLADWNSGIEVREHASTRESPTFKEVYEKWMADCEASNKGVSDSTRRSRTAAFNKLSEIHDRKVASLRYGDIQPIINSCRHMSKSSVHNMLSVVRSVADYAVKYEWATIDFGAHLSAEFTVRTAIHKPYTHEEIQKLWQDSQKEAAQFALITIYTGMRPSELLSAHITDMDIKAGYITAGMKTEAGKDRIIPLHPDILGILRYWTDRKPVRLGTFRDKVWLPYINKTGLDHKPHDGRHTCATLMEAAGIPQNRRKLILGHAITDVTDGVYTHVSPEILIEEIKKIKP